MNREDPVTAVKGVGSVTEKHMEKLGIRTAGDLILSCPRGYDRYELPVKIKDIHKTGIFAVEAVITKRPSVNQAKKTKVVTAVISDGDGEKLKAVWFNMPYLSGTLKCGRRYIFRGRVEDGRYGRSMEQAAVFSPEDYLSKCGMMQPVYDLTAGLTNKAMSRAVSQALSELPHMDDYLPDHIREEYHLSEYDTAVRTIHFPKDDEELLAARRRLIFDEFFLFILCLDLLKGREEKKKNGFPVTKWTKTDKIISLLPYSLTGAQKEVLEDIRRDMEGELLMNRLIQGDVGSGKTIVAVLALAAAAESGYQGAMMAPTEVLARQHYETVTKLFSDCGIPFCVVLLTGSMSAAEKRSAYEKIAEHEADIIIGTHALIQEKVIYDSLGLVITDEQHRFGVRQRKMFSKKGGDPHVLVMSATPIPRTLAMILYGDLDISVMNELPAKRLPIKNCVVDTGYRKNAYRFITDEILRGHQAYVICPLAGESELMDGENVVDYAEKLREELPESVKVEYLHGKLPAAEKERRMAAFVSGDIQVLVSTTVIEVGVDVPNATVMMIENAERFGLAQLHQLRGRVGRGKDQSYCIFVDSSGDENVNKRLEILNKSNDGFYIASEDLKLRGPGDVLGVRQSGITEFSIGDIFGDADILAEASEAVKMILSEDNELGSDRYMTLRKKAEEELAKRASDTLAL